MKPERLAEVQRLLEQAKQRSVEEREAFLDEACGGEDELRAEVATLLAVASEAEGYLETPAVERDDVELPGKLPLGAGAKIGPYRVEKQIGHGGMGVVYLASRADEEYEQRVAIKLLHPGYGGEDVERRFKVERQILANLQHPGIARLLDGGTTEDTQPFLVMEYVDGLPLDVYCSKNQLDIRQRIDLFLKICEAVRFAHRNLVVHRDLKPSNILVTETGEPKLLDFGIAKLIGPVQTIEEGELTRTNVRPMSPQFASPEQIRGLPITTACDVYSLGVLLFKLLTGELPRQYGDFSPQSMEQGLRREPTRPSRVVASALSKSSTTEDETGLSPQGNRRLQKELAGDLDGITLKALREEPEHRYGSVAELVDDLENWQQGLPVRAARQSGRYRFGKLIRRNRLAFGAGATVLVLILGFSVVAASQAKRIAEERDTATAERDTAQQVTAFLVQLFQNADPGNARGEEITVKEALEVGAVRVVEELGDQPEAQITLLSAMGQVFFSLGSYDSSVNAFSEVVNLIETKRPDHHGELVQTLNQLAQAHMGKSNYVDAQKVLDKARIIAVRELAPDNGVRIDNGLYLAQANLGLGNLEEARSSYETVLKAYERLVGPEHFDVGIVLASLGMVNFDLGDFREAEDLYQRAMQIFETTLGADHPNSLALLNFLGTVYWRTGRLELAGETLDRCLDSQERVLGPDHTRVASTLNSLGSVYRDSGNLALAETTLEKALEIKERALGRKTSSVAGTLSNLGATFDRQGNAAKSLQLYLEAYEICTNALGEDNFRTLNTAIAITLSEHNGGAPASEILPRLDAEIEALAAVQGPDHPNVAERLASLARAHLGYGNSDAAEPVFRRSQEIVIAHLGPDHPANIGIQLGLGLTLMDLGRLTEAKTRLDQALEAASESDAGGSTSRSREIIAEVQTALGEWHRLSGDEAAAEDSWMAALALLKQNPEDSIGECHVETRVFCLFRLGRKTEARPFAQLLYDRGWRRPPFVEMYREVMSG